MINHKMIRVVFMGTPTFSVPILEGLIFRQFQIVGVYTQPPRPGGKRGKQLQKTAIHQLADAYNLPVFIPDSLKNKETQEEFAALQPDIAIVAAYGLILPKEILDTPKWGCLNVHASLLPRWRGAAPIQRAILAGDNETGITIMKMDQGLDTGDMLLEKSYIIQNMDTTSLVHDALSKLGADALLEALPLYLNDELKPRTQPITGITYAHKLEKQEGLIDWQQSSMELERKVRALNPWPGVWFKHNGELIKVLEASAQSVSHSYLPGTIMDDSLKIACGEGYFQPLVLQRIGRNPLSREEFLRGYPLQQGTQLLLTQS